MNKDDAALPMVSTQTIFMMAAIVTHEGRYVALMDLPGAFLHTDVDEEVTTVMEGRLAELMAMTAPQVYQK